MARDAKPAGALAPTVIHIGRARKMASGIPRPAAFSAYTSGFIAAARHLRRLDRSRVVAEAPLPDAPHLPKEAEGAYRQSASAGEGSAIADTRLSSGSATKV
jgi:hypothetical protein